MIEDLAGELDRRVRAARRVARVAGDICRRVHESFSSGDVAEKVGREPVTVADYVSQALITDTLREYFPDDGLIAEEGADALRNGDHAGLVPAVEKWFCEGRGEERSADEILALLDDRGRPGEITWVVDPIDGTKGFLRGDQYAVAIGFLHEGEPLAGVLACPAWPGGDGVFFARRGAGAWREMDGGEVQVTASDRDQAAEMRILASVESGHGDPELVREVRTTLGVEGTVRVDSQAKYCFVACGEAEIYLRPQSRPDYRENVWDHAAGVALVEESGGRVTDTEGKPLDFSLGTRLTANRGVLATHGRLHETVVEAIRQAEANLG